jgi:hypothetical protein
LKMFANYSLHVDSSQNDKQKEPCATNTNPSVKKSLLSCWRICVTWTNRKLADFKLLYPSKKFLKYEMMTNSLNDDFVGSPTDTLECDVDESDTSESSSDTQSEISISEKIVLESNEKRLRQRMTSLQTSIINLKEQLKQEKELWKEDMEKIRTLQKQQQEMKCTCSVTQTRPKDVKCENTSRCSSIYNLGCGEINTHSTRHSVEVLKTHSIKQLLELQNYKRKLAETENMCSMELNRVKQSLDDLKTLQNIASEWGKKGGDEKSNKPNEPEQIQEIFVNNFNCKSE